MILKTRAQVKQAFDSMPRKYRKCRYRRHQLEPLSVDKESFPGYWICVELCDECGTERVYKVRVYSGNRFGGVVSSHYIHPEGYLVPGAGRALVTKEARLILMEEIWSEFADAMEA